MANELDNVKKEPAALGRTIGGLLAKVDIEQQFLAVLPAWMDMATFKAQCASFAADPALANCSVPSMMAAIFKCAQLGMYPGPLKHVAVIPRGNDLTIQVQWQGWAFLFAGGGWTVTSHVVHLTDTIEIENVGVDEFRVVRHTYDPFPAQGQRKFTHPEDVKQGESTGLKGAYLRAVNKATGEERFLFVTVDKVFTNMKCAQTQRIWRQHFFEMVRKTPFHVAANSRWLPLGDDLQTRLEAVKGHDEAEAGVVHDAELAMPTIAHTSAPALTHQPATTAPKANDRLAAKLAPKSQDAPGSPQTSQTAHGGTESPSASQKPVPVCGCCGVQHPEAEPNGCPVCVGVPPGQGAFE